MSVEAKPPKVIALVKTTADAIEQYVGKIEKLDDRELLEQFGAVDDSLVRHQALTWTDGVKIGAICELAYKRYGRSGGYQAFLDTRGWSQSKASAWRRIMAGLREGRLPQHPPGDEEEQWSRNAAIEHLSRPAVPAQEGQQKDVSPPRRRKASDDEDEDIEITKEITRLINKLERRARDKPKATIEHAEKLLKAARRIHHDASDAADADIIEQKSSASVQSDDGVTLQ